MKEKMHLKGYAPITVRELDFLADNLEEDGFDLLSYCWHDGEYRCHSYGIGLITVTKIENSQNDAYHITYSDECGDPDFEVFGYDTPIDNQGDGRWNYGLYRKV